MNQIDKKLLDDEIKHQKWCQFKVFLWAFTPGWIALIAALMVFVVFRNTK